MWIDSQTQLSDNQALTTGTIASTNVYDTGAAADTGPGYPHYFFVTATEAFAGGTSVQAVLETSDSVGSGYSQLVAGAVVPLADLKAGKQIAVIGIPHGAKRYLRGSYIVAGTFTAGKVHASLVLNADGKNKGQIASGIPRI